MIAAVAVNFAFFLFGVHAAHLAGRDGEHRPPALARTTFFAFVLAVPATVLVVLVAPQPAPEAPCSP